LLHSFATLDALNFATLDALNFATLDALNQCHRTVGKLISRSVILRKSRYKKVQFIRNATGSAKS